MKITKYAAVWIMTPRDINVASCINEKRISRLQSNNIIESIYITGIFLEEYHCVGCHEAIKGIFYYAKDMCSWPRLYWSSNCSDVCHPWISGIRCGC